MSIFQSKSRLPHLLQKHGFHRTGFVGRVCLALIALFIILSFPANVPAAPDSKPGTLARAHPVPGFWAVHDVRGGTDATNNAKANPGGGYLSHIDHIRQYKYPGGHGNTWGDTALVNDWNVWDKPGFHWDQKYPTASPLWDALSDHSTAWLETGEWIDYEVSVAEAGIYTVTLRMASGQGPDPLPPDQTRHQVRIDVDGKDASGPMPVLWIGEGAYPVDPSPKFNKGPYGWSWIHHFFDVRSPGIKLTAGAHVLRVSMVAGQRGETWIEHITVARPGDPLPVAAPRVKSTLLGEAPTGEEVRGLSELKAGTHWQGGSTPDDIGSLMDGNPWTQIALADPKNFQQAGDFVFACVTNAALGYSHIRLFAPPETKDFPQHWAVQTSPDGLAWSKNIASGVGTPNVTDIRFPPQTGPDVQYVRVILTESALGWWRIGEFQVFGPFKAADVATPNVKPSEPPPTAPIRTVDVTASQWHAVPLAPPSVFEAGIWPGGEGGQWPQAICIDPVDGQFLLYGTDVGGIFRSLDGGKTFEPCNAGYTPRGNCGFAIDPINRNRALAIGANSLEMDCHGIYLTTNQGVSWTHVLPKRTKGYRDFREQIAFDRSSYDAALGYCKVAYWSAAASSKDATGRLYKSDDGGQTWLETPNSQSLGGGIVKIHPAKGCVYVANGGGLFKSSDGGRSFAQKIAGGVTGLDVVATQPDMVFVCKGNEILLSRDDGETFTSMTPTGLPGKRKLLQLRVSPVNVSRMAIENNEGDYQWQKYYSADAGKSWTQSKHDNRLAILPFNPRQPMFAWQPMDEKVAWSFGGDWITRTDDGGATWSWANNGNNGIMAGGRFNFNTQDPDLLYFSAVDYNGALTSDGGKTWAYINLSQIHWGGSISAGYAATPQTLYGVMDQQMRITRDGGKTVTSVGGVSQYGIRVSYGSPTDSNVLFCCNLRSSDQGLQWVSMSGCDGVFTSNPVGDRELYGRKGRNLVKSADQGATWAVLTALPGEIDDVAYDQARNRVYAAANEKLFQYDAGAETLKEITPAIPSDQFGARRINTVAVDPVDPGVVYAGGARNTYSTDTAVVRSTDSGQTWQSLIRGARFDHVKAGPDGGREAITMRVHPKTRELFVGTGCYGFWKFGPPVAKKVEQ